MLRTKNIVFLLPSGGGVYESIEERRVSMDILYLKHCSKESNTELYEGVRSIEPLLLIGQALLEL